MKIVILVGVLVVGWVNAAGAQGLGEVARQEGERRKQAPLGKQYTNDDLRPEPAPSRSDAGMPSMDGPAATSVDAHAPSSASSPGQVRGEGPVRPREKRDETYWRSRARELRSRAEQLRGEVGMLESRLAELDAQTGSSGSAVGEREIAAAALRKQRQNVEFINAELEHFTHEAHKSNVSANWIR